MELLQSGTRIRNHIPVSKIDDENITINPSVSIRRPERPPSRAKFIRTQSRNELYLITRPVFPPNIICKKHNAFPFGNSLRKNNRNAFEERSRKHRFLLPRASRTRKIPSRWIEISTSSFHTEFLGLRVYRKSEVNKTYFQR